MNELNVIRVGVGERKSKGYELYVRLLQNELIMDIYVILSTLNILFFFTILTYNYLQFLIYSLPFSPAIVA